MKELSVLNFSERELKKLPELQISRKIVNTEAKLYIYVSKNKWVKANDVVKLFYDNRSVSMANKVFVLGQLIQKSQTLSMPELVLPKHLVSVNHVISGYSMPWIQDNINLALLLQNPNVSLKSKMKYLKQIYKILSTLKEKQKMDENPVYLGDIHEANFILNVTTQKVMAVDMDSAYFLGALAPTSKFLTFNDKLWDYPSKYPIDIRNDRHIPNDNTTILSFIYMLLNTLSGEKTYNWSIEQYYCYLDFLYQQNVHSELLDSLVEVYTENPHLSFNETFLDSFDLERKYKFPNKK